MKESYVSPMASLVRFEPADRVANLELDFGDLFDMNLGTGNTPVSAGDIKVPV